MKITLSLVAALLLSGCLTPVENVAVNVMLPAVLAEAPNPAKDEAP